MTMPTSEYIEHQCTMQCATNCTIQGASYIRDDITEELARALDMAIENARDDSAHVWSEVFRIRDKYRAINP